jgi:small GTP-binding protein
MRCNRDSLSFKVCICGQQGVGKTAVLHRRITASFSAGYAPTIAAAFATVVEFVGEKQVSLNIWDTAGQEKYHSMMPLYFRNVACVLLVIDCSSTQSWEFVKTWIDKDLIGIFPRPLVYIAINKTDLVAATNIAELQKWAEGMKFPCYLTSAFNGTGINELFGAMAQGVLVQKKERRAPDETSQSGDKRDAAECC